MRSIAGERDVFAAMAQMDPIFMTRKSKKEICFRAGDARSTFDEDLLEKSSAIGIASEMAQKKLYDKLLSEGGTRTHLQNAMLHYFLACKISVEEVGDLILEDEKVLIKEEQDLERDGPPIYTSKDGLSFLTVNLGNFVRGRKNSLPSKFADLIEQQHEDGVGILVKSLARSKSHMIILLEAGSLNMQEAAYLVSHGWFLKENNGYDIFVMIRVNRCYEYIEHLAGSRLPQELHKTFPLAYWIMEVKFGKAPTRECIRKMGTNLSNRFVRAYMEDDIEHCGMTTFRVCAFHPALMHEALGIMLADCFHYQVDIIAGDANIPNRRFTPGIYQRPGLSLSGDGQVLSQGLHLRAAWRSPLLSSCKVRYGKSAHVAEVA